eukprot:5154359-Alexandrium_andersonii.AAC.1
MSGTTSVSVSPPGTTTFPRGHPVRDLLQSACGSAGAQATSGRRSPLRPPEGAAQPCRVRAGPPRH